MIAMKEKEEEYTHVSIYFCRENYYRGSKEIKKYTYRETDKKKQ